jgi:hypothetical protein
VEIFYHQAAGYNFLFDLVCDLGALKNEEDYVVDHITPVTSTAVCRIDVRKC